MSHRPRRSLIWIAFLGLACRMLIPAGYMPAPLGEGGPIMLCPGGLPGGLLERAGDPHAGGHHAHDEDGSGHADAWELCPAGIVLGSAALSAAFDLPILTLGHAAPAIVQEGLLDSPIARPYQARAPPSIRPIEA